MAYLEIDGLTKSYKSDHVIRDLSLTLDRGDLMVVFGPSGCGKTVLLRLIAGVVESDAGDITIAGQSMQDIGPEHRDVAMAFQNFALYPHMTAFENIASPLRARKFGEDEIRRQVHEVADLLRIGHVLTHAPRELSNGQKQRTSLARSLVRKPGLLLLDDPLRNVDAKIRYEMRLELPRVLKEYQSTVIYVTQDYKEAMALGDRVGVLLDGAFRQIDRPAGIYQTPQDTRVARLFGDPPINLFPSRVERGADGGLTVGIGPSRLPAPASLERHTGRDILLGVRPEHVDILFDYSPGALDVELDATTPLNVRTVTLVRAGDRTEILSSTSEERGAVISEAVRQGRPHGFARFNLDAAVCFDPETGARI